MLKDGWEFDYVKMRYHKEEQLDVGTEACYVKHCASTRPAYVLAATKEGKTRNLMYVYQPMGLYKDYATQGSILARFQSFDLALCFMQVAASHLGVRYMDRACTIAVADEEATSQEREEIRNHWRTQKSFSDIRDCEYTVQPDVEELPLVQSWSAMVNLLDTIAPSVCAKHVEWMFAQED